MVFGHDNPESVFKLVDQLQRGVKDPGDINEPLHVAQFQGKFCSLSNRRLTALMMFQALHRDKLVKAWCKICSSDTQKFEEANSTTNDGLGVDTRDGESRHLGAPLFQRGLYVLHELDSVMERHPDEQQLRDLVTRLRTRRSEREMDDGCSLTLSLNSRPEPALPRGGRCHTSGRRGRH